MNQTTQIDFGKLYRYRMQSLEVGPKSASDWNADRARELARNSETSSYVREFISRMDVSGCNTLLDIGCGPGTLAFPLAAKFQEVYALDYSRDMLAVLNDIAQEKKIFNVKGMYRAWEEAWDDVPVCDIAIASRSSTVLDLEAALAKITSKARKRVYLTHMVGQFIEAPVLEAIGRTEAELPDYIYVINILYAMGLHPRVDYIDGINRLAGVKDFNELVNKVSWSIGKLNEVELERLLRHYLKTREDGSLGTTESKWAFISWEPK